MAHFIFRKDQNVSSRNSFSTDTIVSLKLKKMQRSLNKLAQLPWKHSGQEIFIVAASNNFAV